ncbi:MAG: TylF/MycF family methyltransferase [Bacteroidales bacterium]|nr:TylF/MycF family methyltransferase [Bacteroidales bacterium]MCF8375531.1 TylF/MycF family methyltransferase [Bacteroidales bacterium]MCF8399930.1 TylF/MycF family methyltransferase [Bacteroidales bacterium]
MTTLDIIEIILIALLVIIVVYLMINPRYEAPQWKHAKKTGRISKRLKKLYRSYPDKQRFLNFWFQLERIRNAEIPGELAELGVYKGESARIIHAITPERKLHLFDTFAGFQPNDLLNETGTAATYTPRNFADCSPQGVTDLLGKSENIVIHQGHFPESTKDLGELRFAFVNMDADLYRPTLAGLEYFYPRLSPGGVIIIHDYNYKWPGLMQAVDEFCKNNSLVAVQMPDKDSSVMTIKPKNK